jgi:hypothetical protein
MYSQEEKNNMAMKNSAIDKFAAKRGCPEGFSPDGKGNCVKSSLQLQAKTGQTAITNSNLYQKPKTKEERSKNMSLAKQEIMDSTLQARTGQTAIPNSNLYQMPKTKEERLKNISLAKQGKYTKRN